MVENCTRLVAGLEWSAGGGGGGGGGGGSGGQDIEASLPTAGSAFDMEAFLLAFGLV